MIFVIIIHMNIEVEIKIQFDNLEMARKKLRTLGGSLKKSLRQIDEYYVPCHRDFFARKPCPIEWLRVRQNPDSAIFEYDKSIVCRKDSAQDYAEEYEVEVKQPENLRKILKFLDFKKIVTVDKQREYWQCEDFEIALDQVKNLGFFIEVEAQGNFLNAKIARAGCARFLTQKLGIKDWQKQQIKTGYPVLLLKKMK
ncbi:MAG: class IV adenylate cyclase [Patescibacteria group bacterium]|nr:class IV adenylate cyclase [Patescibacteria group bacterium]